MKKTLTILFVTMTTVLFSQKLVSKWAIGFNQSLDACYRITKASSDLSWLKDQLDTSETWKSGYSSTIQINYDLNQKFGLSFACSYDSKGEQLRSTSLVDMKYYKTTYRYLGLPVTFQYTYPLTKGSMVFAAGPELLLSLGNVAHFQMNTSNSDSKILINTQEKKSIVFGSMIRVTYQVNLDKSTQLQFGLLYKNQLTSVTSTDVQRKPYSIGLQLGLSRHF
jgi:hypothetical protein